MTAMGLPGFTRRRVFALVGSSSILAASSSESKDKTGPTPESSDVLSSAADQSTPGARLYPQTALEVAAHVAPANYIHPIGDLRRYGAVGGPAGSIPSTDDSAAWASAASVGCIRIPRGMAFKIATGATVTGQVTILGEGPSSQVYCDGTVLSVRSGTGSIADNFYMGNITAPWIITRTPPIYNQTGNAVFATLQQSSTALGYQPTSNDVDTMEAPYSGTLYHNLTSEQKSQSIGPILLFHGVADEIRVSRIYGRFVRINIMDARNSSIMDCDVRGGKGTWGALTFDNATNAVQVGTGNRAMRNRVQYASESGVVFMNNSDFVMSDNECFMCGESGVQTTQNYGGIFTASVGGAVSGTLQTATTSGTWNFSFDNGETRVVRVARDGVHCSWDRALRAETIFCANFWGGPAAVAIPFLQCFRGQINNNRTYYNKYDGVDASSSYPPNDSAQTFHQVNNNQSYGNGGDGMNLDGKFNECTGNVWTRNGIFGLWGAGLSLSTVSANRANDNNQLRNSNYPDILINGKSAHNTISDNDVYGGPTQNNFGLSAPGTNYCSDNHGYNSRFYFGAAGAITSVAECNTDEQSGLATEQAFIFELVNHRGTLQHSFYQDLGSGVLGNFSSRVIGGTATPTNTPTGTDATTAFANGGKISSTSPNWFIVNTAKQNQAFTRLSAQLVANNTGAALTVQAFMYGVNVDGVTQTRLIFRFMGQTNDDGFILNTSNIASGKYLKVQFFGKIA
jgi:hypothetical protein